MKRSLQLLPGLALALLVFALAGCGNSAHKQTATAPDLPRARVQVQPAEFKPRARLDEVVATVRAKQRATVEAKVSGRITELPLRLGQQVKEGQLLARVDAGEFKARLDQAQAALEQAEREWKRISTLVQSEAATRSEADVAEARLLSTRAAVAEAKTMMSYAEIQAPFEGVITRKLADVGDFATPGKPLLELENPKALELEAYVPESFGGSLKVGDTLTVVVGDGNKVQGQVSEISPSADPASRTFPVKVDLPSVPGARSGQFARVQIPTGETRSLRIPALALVSRGQLDLVFVKDDQQARMRLVKAGKRIGEEVEILAGLDEGDQVIVAGGTHLVDGQNVEAQ